MPLRGDIIHPKEKRGKKGENYSLIDAVTKMDPVTV